MAALSEEIELFGCPKQPLVVTAAGNFSQQINISDSRF